MDDDPNRGWLGRDPRCGTESESRDRPSPRAYARPSDTSHKYYVGRLGNPQ
jgi:hypothetical protein